VFLREPETVIDLLKYVLFYLVISIGLCITVEKFKRCDIKVAAIWNKVIGQNFDYRRYKKKLCKILEKIFNRFKGELKVK